MLSRCFGQLPSDTVSIVNVSMFQTQPQLQRSSRVDEQDLSVPIDMDSSKPSTPQNSQTTSLSASCSETTSPCQSLFSRNHTARSGSAPSSIASSPAVGDAFEGFLTTKTLLTDVKEEPHEREDSDMQDTVAEHRGMLMSCSPAFRVSLIKPQQARRALKLQNWPLTHTTLS